MEHREDSAGYAPDAMRARGSGWRRAAPAATLLVLAPVVSEALFGATRVSVLFVLVPQIAIWGCGALLIRHAVRRGHLGWTSLLLFGLALAVAEECVIQQTSIAPLVGLASHAYGRFGGVNWVYFLWALGYESIWVVVLPIYLTELIYRDRRADVWVGRRGLAVASVALVLGSFVAWFTWTQVAQTKVFHMPEYQPPLLHLLLAVAAIVVLAAAAFGPWTHSVAKRPERDRSAPPPWLVGLVAFGFGVAFVRKWCWLASEQCLRCRMQFLSWSGSPGLRPRLSS